MRRHGTGRLVCSRDVLDLTLIEARASLSVTCPKRSAAVEQSSAVILDGDWLDAREPQHHASHSVTSFADGATHAAAVRRSRRSRLHLFRLVGLRNVGYAPRHFRQPSDSAAPLLPDTVPHAQRRRWSLALFPRRTHLRKRFLLPESLRARFRSFWPVSQRYRSRRFMCSPLLSCCPLE